MWIQRALLPGRLNFLSKNKHEYSFQTKNTPRGFLGLKKRGEKKIKVKLGGQTSSALWFSRSPFVFPCSTVRCGGRKGQRREWRAVVGEKATAGIIAPVGGPHTVGLTCLPAYSAFSSDNAGSPTVKNHEMFFHTCWEVLTAMSLFVFPRRGLTSSSSSCSFKPTKSRRKVKTKLLEKHFFFFINQRGPFRMCDLKQGTIFCVLFFLIKSSCTAECFIQDN